MYYFLRNGVPQGHCSAKEVIFSKAQVYTKLEVLSFIFILAVGISALKKLVVGCIPISKIKPMAFISRKYRTDKIFLSSSKGSDDCIFYSIEAGF